MNGLDIPFPLSEYQIIKRCNIFNLIYPIEHPLALIIRINMMIRAVAFEDAEYSAFMANEIKPQDLVATDAKYLEIGYIRETCLRDVANFEWRLNYGPENLKDYQKLIKSTNGTEYVKIINLCTPDYSLKSLNERYGTSAKN